MNFEFMGTKVCKGCFPLSTSTKAEIIYEPSQREESKKPLQAIQALQNTVTLLQSRSGVRIISGFRRYLILKAGKMTHWIKQAFIFLLHVWRK